MGAAKSTSCGRRVQPLLPFQFRYRRHSPPSDSLIQPLQDNQNQFIEEEVAVALEANQEKNARLEKEIRDIKGNLSRLEAKLHAHRPQPKHQTDQMMKKQGEDYEELKKLNADLEVKFLEMARTIADIKCSLSGLMLQIPAESGTTSKSSTSASGIYVGDEEEEDDRITRLLNYISASLIVLVFLISIIIGFSL